MRRSHALGAALAASQIAYGLEAPRPPWMTRGVVALLLTTSTADALEQRGARGAAVVAAAGSIGFGAELLGVHTGRPFGPYDYSGKLGPKVADVPVMAAAAWALLARPSRVAGDWAARSLVPVAHGVGRSDAIQGHAKRGLAPTSSGIDTAPARPTSAFRAVRIAAAATALTAWDVFLDPRMVREGYWRWPGGGRYEGIPASNYVGWWVTGLAIFAAAELLDGADDPAAFVGDHPRNVAKPAKASPASAPSRVPGGERSGDTALAIYAWTWVGELIANVLLWKRPKVALAGGLSMALVAAPAIAQRLRAAAGTPRRVCTPR